MFRTSSQKFWHEKKTTSKEPKSDLEKKVLKKSKKSKKKSEKT